MHSNSGVRPYYFNSETGRGVHCFQMLGTHIRSIAQKSQKIMFSSTREPPFTSHPSCVLFSMKYFRPPDWNICSNTLVRKTPWSKDLPLSLWGFMNDQVYLTSVRSSTQGRRRIKPATRDVSQEVLDKVWINLKDQLYALIWDLYGQKENEWHYIKSALAARWGNMNWCPLRFCA